MPQRRYPPELIPLGRITEHMAMLDVECSRCPRRERLSLARLVAQKGADYPFAYVLDVLSADCPSRQSASVYDLCRPCAPALAGLFLRVLLRRAINFLLTQVVQAA